MILNLVKRFKFVEGVSTKQLIKWCSICYLFISFLSKDIDRYNKNYKEKRFKFVLQKKLLLMSRVLSIAEFSRCQFLLVIECSTPVKIKNITG